MEATIAVEALRLLQALTVAQELHDGVPQFLGTMLFRIRVLEESASGQDPHPIRRVRGLLSMDSVPGKGTKIAVRIPCAGSEPDDGAAPEQKLA